jgi:predicted site-specific integrase-resolvase
MKLSQWAKQQGITYGTALRWFTTGKLPVESYQTPTGAIFVNEKITIDKIERIVIYCRVSNQSRKEELNYQVQRCETFCLGKGLQVHNIYKEVASGMNDNRREFWKMLESSPTKIIVENKDRLTRFGFNYLNKLLSKLGCEIIVINCSDRDEEDLIKDLVSIMTSFCCRLYGLRRGKNKIKQIKDIINNND